MPTLHEIVVDGASLTIPDVCRVARDRARVVMSEPARQRMHRMRALIDGMLERGDVVYGVTTGFGKLSDMAIPPRRRNRPLPRTPGRPSGSWPANGRANPRASRPPAAAPYEIYSKARFKRVRRP